MTFKQRLKDWIASKKRWGHKYLKTSDVYRWGVENHSNRAVRNCQDFAAEEILLERLTKEEIVLMGFTGNEGVWKII